MKKAKGCPNDWKEGYEEQAKEKRRPERIKEGVLYSK